MKRFIPASGLALVLAAALSLAGFAQTADDPGLERGTVLTASQLEDTQVLSEVKAIQVVDVEPLLKGDKAEIIKEKVLNVSDPAAIRDFLAGDAPASDKIKDALGDAKVTEDEVVSLVLRENGQLVVFYRRGT